jgi:hypothetical protein
VSARCASCVNARTFKGGKCPHCDTVWYRRADGTMQILGDARLMEVERRRIQEMDDDEYIAHTQPEVAAEIARLAAEPVLLDVPANKEAGQ